MPRLRVLAGPTLDALEPISANDGVAHDVSGAHFEGRVAVYIRDERAAPAAVPAYFARKERKGVTWSIQVQGRFREQQNADDVLFGNVFARPLRLPWGAGAALKFMHIVDPSLEHDLMGPAPWALSPLLNTMPYLAHAALPPAAPAAPPAWPEFPPRTPLADAWPEGPTTTRRRRMGAAERRRTALGPRDLLTADFCYGFLTFPSITLRLPGGLAFNCLKYWDGQPVSFVCCARAPGGRGPGHMFWCVVFEVVHDDDEDGGGEGDSADVVEKQHM